MMLFDEIPGRVLVVGGTGKLGARVTLALLSQGVHVTVTYRSLDNLRLLKKTIKSTLGSDRVSLLSSLSLDISNSSSVEDCVSEIKALIPDERFGGCVYAAYTRPNQQYLNEVSGERFAEGVSDNSYPFFVIAHTLCQQMSNMGRGSIVYIGSIYGKVAPDFSLYDGLEMGCEPDYVFVKHGMSGLVKYLAGLYGKHGVRVNVLCSGGIKGVQNDVFIDRYIKKTTLGRMGSYEDLVGCVLFLLSDSSQYVSGTELTVDGGFCAL